MALANNLNNGGMPPQRLEVSATVTFDKIGDGWRVVSSALTVQGWVQGADAAALQQAAEAARDGCPISQALKGNIDLNVEGTLAT